MKSITYNKLSFALIFSCFFIAFSTNVYGQDQKCSLSYPAKCQSTNQLSWSTGFKDKVAQFLHGAVFEHPMRKGNMPEREAIRNLSGISQGVEIYPDYILFKGCSAHACFAGGSIAVSKHGQGILGLALAQPIDCENCNFTTVNNYAVTIFLPKDRKSTDLEEKLKTWGISKVYKEVSSLNTSIGKQQIIQQTPPVYIVKVGYSGARDFKP